MTTIYFIRHGQASFGAESYDQLSPNGELQAKILGQYFDQILKKRLWWCQAPCSDISKRHVFLWLNAFLKVDVLTDSAWNEFNHQQVFAHYGPRFNEPHLLKADVAKEVEPTCIFGQDI